MTCESIYRVVDTIYHGIDYSIAQSHCDRCYYKHMQIYGLHENVQKCNISLTYYIWTRGYLILKYHLALAKQQLKVTGLENKSICLEEVKHDRYNKSFISLRNNIKEWKIYEDNALFRSIINHSLAGVLYQYRKLAVSSVFYNNFKKRWRGLRQSCSRRDNTSIPPNPRLCHKNVNTNTEWQVEAFVNL